MYGAVLAVAVVLVLTTRVLTTWCGKSQKRRCGQQAPTMVVLGSGGHTAEMLALLRGLDPGRYTPLTFVVAASDRLGAAKAASFRQSETPPAVDVIPRSREVGQSYLTSVATTLRALATAFVLVWRRRPHLLLVNGPGTCIPICAAALLLRLAGAAQTRIVYVESIARVRSLSLTGLILYHCRATSAFFVQWPALQQQYPRSTYEGRLY